MTMDASANVFEEEISEIRGLIGDIHTTCQEMRVCMQTFRTAMRDRKRTCRRQ